MGLQLRLSALCVDPLWPLARALMEQVMKKVVVLFTKPFGAYAKGDRAGFDAGAAQHLKDLGVAKQDAEQELQEPESAEGAHVDAADEPQLPEPEQADEEQPKPAGKAPKGAKA